jgi:hypothetical protein
VQMDGATGLAFGGFFRQLRVLDLSELTFTSEELENGFSILSLSPNIESITLCNCVGF